LGRWGLLQALLRRVRVSVLGCEALGRGGSIARLRLTLRLESAAAIRHGRIHVRTTCHRISLLWRGTISSWAAEASSGRKAASTAASRAVVRGLVYTNRPAVELDVVHGCNRFLGILLLGVSHESETAASAGISILNDDLDDELVRSDTSDIVCGK